VNVPRLDIDSKTTHTQDKTQSSFIHEQTTIHYSPVLVSPIALTALVALSPIDLLVFSANSFVRLPNTLNPVNA
jgi:hypothetical protein